MASSSVLQGCLKFISAAWVENLARSVPMDPATPLNLGHDVGARTLTCGWEAHRPWKALDRRPLTIWLVADSGWRLNWNPWLTMRWKYNPEDGECSKIWSRRESILDAKEVGAWRSNNWSSTWKPQIGFPPPKAARTRYSGKKTLRVLVFRHFSPNSLSIIWRYPREWHPRSVVLALRSTLHQKQQDTLKGSRFETFWHHSWHRRSYLLPKSVCFFFSRIDSNKSSEPRSPYKRKDTKPVCQSTSNLSCAWRTTHNSTSFRYHSLDPMHVPASRQDHLTALGLRRFLLPSMYSHSPHHLYQPIGRHHTVPCSPQPTWWQWCCRWNPRSGQVQLGEYRARSHCILLGPSVDGLAYDRVHLLHYLRGTTFLCSRP